MRRRSVAFRRELPDDLLADILRRLRPRSLAVSRRVCRAWRDLVDARRLLRTDLLPLSVGGIYVHYCTFNCPDFFARPTTGPSISGELEFIPGFTEAEYSYLLDSCGGLLLCRDPAWIDRDYVANPATRRCAQLPWPPWPPCWQGFSEIKCLVYDPTLSPHYNVLLVHSLPPELEENRSKLRADEVTMQSEGPALSSYPLQAYVYSSATGRWEERWFAPEVGQPAIVDEDIYWILDRKVYWRGAVYFLCANGFVLRISMSNAKYRLIRIPLDVEFRFSDICWYQENVSFGRSEKGVYLAFKYDCRRLRIFLLNESCSQMEWELRHSVDLRHSENSREYTGGQQNGPWILQDINVYKYPVRNDNLKKVGGRFEWNSDDDNVLSTEDIVKGYCERYTGFLGFHPFKEIVFLHTTSLRAVAYHWNTSKFQELGRICSSVYEYESDFPFIETSFIYTPCWMEDFPNESEVEIEDLENLYKL